MITLDLTKEINGDQLCKEMGADDIYVANNKIIINGDVNKDFAQSKLDAHIPQAAPQPTTSDKLAFIGITAEDLRALLL